MDKNKRVMLLKEETINEITLNDLLDLAGKSEIAVMQLADNCMKFNSRTLKTQAAAVKKQLSQLSDMIRSQIMGNESEANGGDEKTSLDRSPGEGNNPLAGQGNPNANRRLESDNLGVETKPAMDELTESKKLKKFFKLLKEAFEEVETEEPETEEVATEPEDSVTGDIVEPTEENQTIDLSTAFNNVIDGLTPEQFDDFKLDIVSGLKASGIVDGNYLSIVTELEQSKSIDDFNITLDSLYNYADDNNIKVKTEAELPEQTPTI